MPDFSGRLRACGRAAILVSRYNELITTKLLEGALLGGDSKSELTDAVTELQREVENYNNSVQ